MSAPVKPPGDGFQSQRNPTQGMDEAAHFFFQQEQGGGPPKEEEERAEPEQEEHADTEEARSEAPEPQEEVEAPAEEPGEAEGEAEEGEDGEAVEVTSEDDDEDPLIEVQVQGETLEVPFSELRSGYMKHADYKAKTAALADERRTFDAERQQHQASVQEQIQRATMIADALEQELRLAGPNPQEMARLRHDDPAEWVAKQREAEQRRAWIHAARAEQQRVEREQIQQRVPQERNALMEKAPEFKTDAGTFNEEHYSALGRWMLDPAGGGLQPEEWQQVIDHRLVRIASLAMKAATGMKDERAKEDRRQRIPRKLAKLPRVRSGATQPRGDSRREEYDGALSRLKNSGGNSMDDIAGAFIARERMKSR